MRLADDSTLSVAIIRANILSPDLLWNYFRCCILRHGYSEPESTVWQSVGHFAREDSEETGSRSQKNPDFSLIIGRLSHAPCCTRHLALLWLFAYLSGFGPSCNSLFHRLPIQPETSNPRSTTSVTLSPAIAASLSHIQRYARFFYSSNTLLGQSEGTGPVPTGRPTLLSIESGGFTNRRLSSVLPYHTYGFSHSWQ